jgi:hypothetical protein
MQDKAPLWMRLLLWAIIPVMVWEFVWQMVWIFENGY